MTPEQCRQARKLLGWSRAALSELARCSPETIYNFEAHRHQASTRTLRSIREALRTAGVIFVVETGDGLGVRLTKKPT